MTDKTNHLGVAQAPSVILLEQAKAALLRMRTASIAGCEEGYGKPEKWAEELFASHGPATAAIKAIEAHLAAQPPAAPVEVSDASYCPYCDLEHELHEDAQGFHHIVKGERVECCGGLPAAAPVAWSNEHQLAYLKDPQYREIPMAMWAKRDGRADVPLYRLPAAAPVDRDPLVCDKCNEVMAAAVALPLSDGPCSAAPVISQHIGWLKQYAASMNENNWRDMRALIDRQLIELSEAARAPAAPVDPGVRQGEEHMTEYNRGYSAGVIVGMEAERLLRAPAAPVETVTDEMIAISSLNKDWNAAMHRAHKAEAALDAILRSTDRLKRMADADAPRCLVKKEAELIEKRIATAREPVCHSSAETSGQEG